MSHPALRWSDALRLQRQVSEALYLPISPPITSDSPKRQGGEIDLSKRDPALPDSDQRRQHDTR